MGTLIKPVAFCQCIRVYARLTDEGFPLFFRNDFRKPPLPAPSLHGCIFFMLVSTVCAGGGCHICLCGCVCNERGLNLDEQARRSR